ncbi:MAG: hypothetical protein AAB388_01805 [Patescibacteria group bacterium]
MGLFSGHSRDRYGVIFDIGSGSVLAAIVHSNATQSHPTIVWSFREHVPLRSVDSMNQTAKAVMTALVNVSLRLDSEGRKALALYAPGAKLSDLQCGISAPWSYTVTKTINYVQDEPFVITNELIEEFVFTTQQKIEEELRENESVSDLGLQIITRTTMDVFANGYRVMEPEGEKASEMALTQATVVAQKYLINVIEDMREKLFPTAKSRKLSFILMLYCITRDVLSHVNDVCLVDITYEATEIGVVRDGSLRYCTHTAFGAFSLAREIAAVTNVPLHEAFGYLHSDRPRLFMESLNDAKRVDIEAIFGAYIERVSELFHETGDALSIPKKISLHVPGKTETLFADLIAQAAKRATKLDHSLANITDEIYKQNYKRDPNFNTDTLQADSALFLAAQFFHKQTHCLIFEYL